MTLILSLRHGGLMTAATAPTAVPTMYMPNPAPAQSGTTAPVVPFWDQVARSITQSPTETWASCTAVLTSTGALDAQREHLRNTQYTFIFALAKKGDATQRFTTKAVRGMQQELGIESIEIYAQELSWLCQKVIRTAQLTTNDARKSLFTSIETSMAGVERIHTIVGWATTAGTTKLQFVKRAYKAYPTFDWTSVERIFSGQLLKANQMNTTLTAEPYKAFYTSTSTPGSWEPTGFLEVAHVCWMLLDQAGHSSVAGYKGFSTHFLEGEEFWRKTITSYLLNCQSKRVGDVNVTA